jgi:hypothetical protein
MAISREETGSSLGNGTLVDVAVVSSNLVLGGTALDFAAGTDRVTIADASAIRNIFDGGGSVRARIKADTMGGGSLGRVIHTGGTANIGWTIYILTASGSDCYLGFIARHSTTDGFWRTTDRVITLGTVYDIRVDYDSDDNTNNPTIYINGSSVGVSRTTGPVGTRGSDSGYEKIIGNRGSPYDRGWDGIIDELKLYKSSGLVWYSRFNSGSGTAVVDEVNGNNGSITGATWATFYNDSGYRIWEALNLSGVAKASAVEFTRTTPSGTTLKVYALVTSSSSVPAHDATGWEEQTSGNALTVIATNDDLTGKRLWLMAVLETTSTSSTPNLSRLYAIVYELISKSLSASVENTANVRKRTSMRLSADVRQHKNFITQMVALCVLVAEIGYASTIEKLFYKSLTADVTQAIAFGVLAFKNFQKTLRSSGALRKLIRTRMTTTNRVGSVIAPIFVTVIYFVASLEQAASMGWSWLPFPSLKSAIKKIGTISKGKKNTGNLFGRTKKR